MTQFKDKSQNSSEAEDGFISAGLLDYPVLQAADILVYRADYVPVGKDQEQHLELSRNIAQRFNNQVGKEYFVLPEPLFTETPKIMSTADPSRKMSKSAGEKHYINVFADEARLRKQIQSAVTDVGAGEMGPGVANLFELLKAAQNMEAYQSLKQDFDQGTLKYSDLKQTVADTLVALNQPFLEKKKALQADKKALKAQIKESSARIRQKATQTLREVKELAGLMNV
jgi:tryptophanyl-tRNA synthetase